MKSESYVREIEDGYRPPWTGMIPVKRYRYFTMFYKPSLKGTGYYECFLNIDVDKKALG